MMQAQNNVLMMTGVSPSIGKTFVCANGGGDQPDQ